MQVSLDSNGALERRLRVAIPEDDILRQVESRLKDLSRSTQIDGFRRGKVPMRVIQQRFGSQVRQEVLGEVMRSSFQSVVSEQRLRPAGEPAIDAVEAAPGQGLAYTAVFEVYPEVRLAPLEELEFERPTCEVTEADLDAMTETLRLQRRTWQPVERASQAGDRMVIDFTGRIDGEPFEGGTGAGVEVELGAGRFVPGFEEQLRGLTAGTRTAIDVTFPADYHQADLAGRPVSFSVEVQRVLEPQLPALDESFFASFDVYDGGIDRFRSELRENLEREKRQLLRTRLKKSAFDALLAKNEVPVPRALIEVEARRMHEELRGTVAMRGGDPAQVASLAPAVFEEPARRRVKLGLLVAEIVRAQGLRPDPARVRALVEETAASYNEPAQVVQWYYAERERLADVEAAALEDVVVDWLVAKAHVIEVAHSFDALRNPVQTPERG